MKSSACKMIRTLVQLMRTLDKMPDARIILMKLLYYDDVTPMDYEPPFFRECTEEETRKQWTKSPLRMEIGNVNSKHFMVALKVKSVLDPCEDDNENTQDASVSLGADSQNDDSSNDGSEVSSSQEEYVVAPVERELTGGDDAMVSDDVTQDAAEDEHQLGRVKGWITSNRFENVEFTDVLSNFPDISMVLTEEIMEKLALEGFITKTGKDAYAVNKLKEYEFDFHVKEEIEDHQVVRNGDKNAPGSGEDHMYMQALYHALPMEYVSIAKLQTKLEGKANQSTVRKLIDKMAKDGFVEATSNHRGKRVIHSELTQNKLNEVKKTLNMDTMEKDVPAAQNKQNQSQILKYGNKKADASTCGVLHSVGSDITCMLGRSESAVNQNGSLTNGQSDYKTREPQCTPTSKAGPIASSESIVPAHSTSRLNGLCNNGNEGDDIMCSRPSQYKHARKASTVKEPIIQCYKRIKSEAV